ncbi:hypothetical protein LDENG_00280140 [Lucifuga dentata]|nr:hypothetical protein LDENG_00280140 [Lucifuga dentata]
MENFKESEKDFISQDVKVEMKEVPKVKVITEQKEVKTEIKQDIQKADSSPATSTMSTVAAGSVSISDNQSATPTPAKRKKKSKKSKGGSQSCQTKEASTESKTDSSEAKMTLSEKSPQETVGAEIHKSIIEEHMQVQKEVINTESKEHQNSQEDTVQKPERASQKKKGVAVIQLNKDEQTQESWDVPITVSGKTEQNKLIKFKTEKSEESQRQEIQVLISHITELQRVSEKTDSKSVKTLLSTVPEWLMNPERKCELEGCTTESGAYSYEEILSHVKQLAESKVMTLEGNETMKKHDCEPISEKGVPGGATPRMSKISIGSAKVDSQTKKTSQERKKEEVSQSKSTDLRAPSPLLRMRSPSPTFITIESTQRTDSPQRVTPSPTLLYRSPTPPTPPPRRCDTPTLRLNRITPSPTFDKAENLTRLKDTTAKLSRGVTPPPLLSPQQITEKKSEIVESPASFHRQIKIESQSMEVSESVLNASENFKINLFEDIHQAYVNPAYIQTDPANIPGCVDEYEIQNKSKSTVDSHPIVYQKDMDLDEDMSELSVLSASVKEKKEFFEEAQKAKISKSYVRKDPIDIPERLGPDMDESDMEKEKGKDELPRADLPSLVNKFESPEEKLSTRKELISLTEWLENEAKIIHSDKEDTDMQEKDMPTFDIQAIKNVFEMGEQTSPFKEEKGDQEEPMSSLSEATDTSKQDSPQAIKPSSLKPSGYSETNSVTEHFSDVDGFGGKVTGTRTTVTEHSESVSSQQAPFSYADAVKRKAAPVRHTQTYDEASTENLLRNFHKTWTESETVFKSLGYTVSEETTSQVVTHQTKTVSSGKEIYSMMKANRN